MQQPRILLLFNRVPYPLTDGGALAMQQMIGHYHKAGWQVRVLMMNTSRHRVSEAAVGEQYAALDGCTVVPVRTDITPGSALRNLLFSRLPNHAQRFFIPAFREQLEKLIGEFRPDYIQSESLFLTGYLPAIRALSSAPVILRMHNIEYQIWQRLAAAARQPIKKAYLRNLAARMKTYEEQAWQQYDALLPITAYDASVAEAVAGKVPTLTVPFGVETEQVHKNNTAQPQWVGYHLGAMDWLPNREAIEWFTREAWPVVRRLNPDFRFYYAGRHMPEQLLHPSQPGLQAMGAVTNAEDFIADKKILLVPLLSGGGLRIKILEAMSRDKVVISTTTGMQGIDAAPGIHYLQADTAEDFARSIRYVLDHPAEAEAIARQAQELLQKNYNVTLVRERLTGWLLEHFPLV